MKSFTCLAIAFFISVSTYTAQNIQYRVLATNRTSTMEKELNDAAASGFRCETTMGGESTFGGKEVIAVMSRSAGDSSDRFRYRLLATNKTSTMQKELQSAARDGYVYRRQTVFETTFGGREVVVILERDTEAEPQTLEYRILATSRTSTMDRELAAAGREGFALVDLTVAETAFGGKELVAILSRIVRGN
jgi:hypothetical protein